MAIKQTNEEIRREVLEEDKKKDVNIYIAIPIGVIAAMSSIAAMTAVIMMRALEYFRADVPAYWLSCVPFIFPVVTGLYAAYKKQFGLLGVHFSVTALALLLGGFGYGLSVEPVFLNRKNCRQHDEDLTCDKESLAWIYLVSGALAAGLAILGLLLTICACYHASKRIAKRHRREEVQHLRDVEEKQKELRRMKAHSQTAGGSIRLTAPKQRPAANGIPQTGPVSQAVQPSRAQDKSSAPADASQRPNTNEAKSPDATTAAEKTENITTRL